MEGEDLVPGSGWVSSDSNEQNRILSLNDNIDPASFWSARDKDMNVIAAATRNAPPPRLVNPREGHHDSWQLGESVDDFIKRLPPLTTSSLLCDWIWVENPYHTSHAKSKLGQVDSFMERGFQALEQSSQKRVSIQNRTDKRGMTKLLNEESKALEQRITQLATETNILSGKWMLFPPLIDVTRIWKLIVEGVTNNRLGPVAKIAPNDGKEGDRLICVYTKDFRDEEDVLRVLQELVAMGLVGSGKPFYYKSDPYTYLNIYRETAADYGLRASLYSSQTMLSQASLRKSKSGVQKKNSTINDFFNW